MIHPHSGTTICRSKRFNSMFRRALLLLGFCRRKYKAGSLSRMSVPLMTAGFSDAALDCRDFKQARFQPEATRSRSTEEGPPHGSPSLEHHCIWLPAGRLYTAAALSSSAARCFRQRLTGKQCSPLRADEESATPYGRMRRPLGNSGIPHGRQGSEEAIFRLNPEICKREARCRDASGKGLGLR